MTMRGSKQNGSSGSSHNANRNNRYFDYEFISNDPEENADNFDPKWAPLREMTTDEERYQAIRKRWGNSAIPDPSVNLTFRQVENNSARVDATEKIEESSRSSGRRERRVRQYRRSRSCTRPYEDLILNLQKDIFYEYSQLTNKLEYELQEMLQIQVWELFSTLHYGNWGMRLCLEQQQKQNMESLLSNHYQQIVDFIGKKNESMDVCQQYMEEVRAFFTFYQKINDDEVTLQMTDEQYEHTVETEKMYSLYKKFYN